MQAATSIALVPEAAPRLGVRALPLLLLLLPLVRQCAGKQQKINLPPARYAGVPLPENYTYEVAQRNSFKPYIVNSTHLAVLAAEIAFDVASIRRNRRVCRPLSQLAAVNALTAGSSSDDGGVRCVRRPCSQTRGTWCADFERQAPVPWRPGLRGNRNCPATNPYGTCNRVGVCNAEVGVCQCPAGWTGPDCGTRELRPCTNRRRGPNDTLHEPTSHVGPDGRDADPFAPGWTASRCGGVCDAEVAACYCPPDTKHGRLAAPPGSPPGTPPLRRGRPLEQRCAPNSDGKGRKIQWGQVSYDEVLGPNGWCNADEATTNMTLVPDCRCSNDGLAGRLCELETEMTCLNQCTGHGSCQHGFCKCDDGWYGTECGIPRADLSLSAEAMAGNVSAALLADKPWLVGYANAVPAAAQVPPPAAVAAAEAAAVEAADFASAAAGTAVPTPRRLRPLIYVYDMPPRFTTRMVQYSVGVHSCYWRRFGHSNTSDLYFGGYSVEQYLHEVLLTSPHRTLDPEEADFFYVPIYAACLAWPVLGWADMPFWHVPYENMRPMHLMYLWLDALAWIKEHYGRYWQRRGGRDHVWTTVHDEGACYMPTEIFNASIMLTHWGRMDLEHRSGTAYFSDEYNREFPPQGELAMWAFTAPLMPDPDWRTRFKGHPCYDPEKDLVIPGFKPPHHYRHSPLLGAPPLERDILLYLRGDVGVHRDPKYSRGIRQRVHTLAKEHRWAEREGIVIGDPSEVSGSYSEQLARSMFCLVPPGDGYAMRAEDAVLHGCIPVVVMDGVHAVLESLLEYDSFSLRLHEGALDERLPSLLKSIPASRVARMQHNLAAIMARFAYGHHPLLEQRIASERAQWAVERRRYNVEVPANHPFAPFERFPRRHDALSTIIRWLHSRIPPTASVVA